MGIDPRVFRTDPSDPTKLVLATQEEPAAPADQLVREDTFTNRIGEVQAVPTANTLLGRLKDIYDRLLAGGKTLKSKDFSVSATGVIVAAVVGKKIRVYAYKFVVAGAVSVNWRSGGATNLEGAQPYAANSGAIEGVTPPAFLFETAQGQSLDLVLSGAITVAGRVSYWDDA